MQLSTEINQETRLKLERRARRIGLTPEEAVRIIATKGVKFFFGAFFRCYQNGPGRARIKG